MQLNADSACNWGETMMDFPNGLLRPDVVWFFMPSNR